MKSSPSDARRSEHLWILAIAVVALTGSFILQPSSTGGLSVYVPILGQRVELPETCMSKRVLGITCPGCGLTRSFVATARGDMRGAWLYNPMGPILFLLVMLQIPYRALEYSGWGESRSRRQSLTSHLYIVTYAIMIALIVSWVVRLVVGGIP